MTAIAKSGGGDAAPAGESDSMAAFVPPPRLQYETARIWSHRAILHNILHLNLPPGSCLVEAEVRRRLGVSRTPVREALMQLAQENFVRIVPQKGTYVTRIDMSEVLRLRYIRRAVEAETARLAAAALTPDDEADLWACLERQRAAADRHDLEDFIACDDAMHRALYGAAGKSEVWDFFARTNLQHYRSRILGLRVGRTLGRLIGEHEELVAALAAHDPERSDVAVRRHLSDQAWNADSVLEKYPDYILPPGGE